MYIYDMNTTLAKKVGRQFGLSAAQQPSPLSLNLNSIPALVAGTGGHLNGRKTLDCSVVADHCYDC